jgi:hypothetical protein
MANVLYGHVESIIRNAQEKETNKQWKEAFDIYMNAVKLLLLLIDKETDAERKEKFGLQASEVMDKAEAIKEQYLQQEIEKKEIAFMGNSEKYTVHFRLEKVCCVKLDSSDSATELLVEGTLQLFCIDGRYFLNIGNKFAYELNDTIPCLSMTPGKYILKGPDDYFFGIIFPDGIPGIYCEKFEEKLAQICVLKASVTRPSKIEEPDEEAETQIVVASTVETVSNEEVSVQREVTIFHEEKINSMAQKVDFGGQLLSHGILVGADFISKHIETGAEKLKDYINPVETAPEIPETIKTTLKIAKQVTPHIVELTGALASTVHAVAKGVGNYAVESVKEKLRSSDSNKISLDDPRITAAKNLGKAGAVAFVSIWSSLEEAGMNLTSSTGKAVVNIIHHKYGDEAGQVASDGIAVAQDVLQTGQTLKSMGIRRIAKGVVKDSTKTLIGVEKKNKPEKVTVAITEDDFETFALPATPDVALLEDGNNAAFDIDSDDEH